MKHLITPTCCILLIIASFGIHSCFLHFYQTNSVDSADARSIRSLIDGNKYFILHANHRAFAFSHVEVRGDNLEGDIEPLPIEHLKYIQPEQQDRNRFPLKDKAFVLYEVHLYTQDSIVFNSHGSIPLKHINRLDAYSLDRRATSQSRVLSIIGVTLGTALIVGTIAAAAVTASHPVIASSSRPVSCSPKVYLLDGDKRELAGVLCSGAIFAPLERTDYLPLPGARAAAGHLSLQIRMAEYEELNLHGAQLVRVEHRADRKVLIDRYGKVLSYRQPKRPEKASIGDGRDVRAEIDAEDGDCYSFTNHPAGQNASDIELDFKKPAGARSGKLVIKARNTVWGAYIFKDFKSLYGEYYPTLQQLKDRSDREKLLQCELDQDLPLKVLVKKAGEWQLVDYFFTTGNDAPREMILQMDLAGLEKEKHVQLRLQTAYQFWELDYAGMDFSGDEDIRTTYLSPQRVWGPEKEQPGFDFVVAPAVAPDFEVSYFLAGTAFYHDNTPFPGKPRLDKLAAFSAKGAFDRFSRQKFEEVLVAVRSNTNKEPATADKN